MEEGNMNNATPKKKYRMVALDLDGTLLGPDHVISETSVQYLNELHKRGLVICIATGRSVGSTYDTISALDLPFLDVDGSTTFYGEEGGDSSSKKEEEEAATADSAATATSNADGGGDVGGSVPTNETTTTTTTPSILRRSSSSGLPVVCSNGAQGLQIRTLRKQISNVDPVFLSPVPLPLVLRTIDVAQKHGLTVQYYLGDDVYVHAGGGGDADDADGVATADLNDPTHNPKHVALIRRYAALTGKRQILCERTYRSVIDKGLPSKLLVLCDEEELDDTVRLVRDQVGAGGKGEGVAGATIIRGTPPFFVEILASDVCKGAGLQLMCQELSVPLSQVIAFGDGDNDLEFIQLAGLGIAMANARQTLKDVADVVSEWTNGEDGVVKTLKKMEEEGLLDIKE